MLVTKNPVHKAFFKDEISSLPKFIKNFLNLKQINWPFFLSYRTSFSQHKATVAQLTQKSWVCTALIHRLPMGKEKEDIQLFVLVCTAHLICACGDPGTVRYF